VLIISTTPSLRSGPSDDDPCLWTRLFASQNNGMKNIVGATYLAAMDDNDIAIQQTRRAQLHSVMRLVYDHGTGSSCRSQHPPPPPLGAGVEETLPTPRQDKLCGAIQKKKRRLPSYRCVFLTLLRGEIITMIDDPIAIFWCGAPFPMPPARSHRCWAGTVRCFIWARTLSRILSC
jgi:hypothetical protein